MRKIKLNKTTKAKLKNFANDFHTMIIEYDEEDRLFCISFPDLPECVAKGKELKEVLNNVKSAKWTWGFASMLNGHELPKSKNKRVSDQYVFVRLTNEERYELNKRAWENKKAPAIYAKSLITEKIESFEKEVKLSDAQAFIATPQDVGIVICGVTTQKITKKPMEIDASQVAFGA